MVMDDEAAIGQLCKRVLNKEGYIVDIARNGIEGKKKIEQNEYDLIILDVRAPLMDGEELYRYINKNYNEMCERVIFCTGAVLGGAIPTFLKESGRPFLPKPFTPDELRDLVRDFFKNGRERE